MKRQLELLTPRMGGDSVDLTYGCSNPSQRGTICQGEGLDPGYHVLRTERAFCDKELAETSAKKDEKMNEIKKVSTEIDSMTSRAEMDKTRLDEKKTVH